jgi:hypothetical protein
MRKPVLGRVLLLAAAAALSAAGACSHSSPTTPPPPVDLYFEPSDSIVTGGALQTLELRVRARDGSAAQALFLVDGDTAAAGASYVWRADRPGLTILTARAQREGRQYSARWRVTVTDEGALPTPPVTHITAEVGPLPGTIHIQWEAPPASQYTIPPKEYVVGRSSGPILSFSDLGVDTTVVRHQNLSIVHELTASGLAERQVYHFRVKVRDTFGRQSALGTEAVAPATGHYDVVGEVDALRPGLPLQPQDEILVGVGDYKQLTDVDGRFALLHLPDTYEAPLTLADTRLALYSLQTPPLPRVDQSHALLLFERGIVHVVQDTSEADVSTLAFFKTILGKDRPFSTPLYRWVSYPVRFHAAPFVDAFGVDYRRSILQGIQRWNAAAGETLLEAVDSFDPTGDAGADYAVDLADDSGFLGDTRMIDPPESVGHVREVVPRLITMHLQTFRTQEIADLVITHELGHVLLLGHSTSITHLMYANPSPLTDATPTPEEGYFARLVAHMPQGTDLGSYAEPHAKLSASSR